MSVLERVDCTFLKSLIASVGGQELFNNHDIAQLNLSKHLPVFYCKIITCWQDLIASNPKSKNNVLEQIVWNNKSITSDKKSIYYPLCSHAGILKIKDLLTHSKNALRRLILFITNSCKMQLLTILWPCQPHTFCLIASVNKALHHKS